MQNEGKEVVIKTRKHCEGSYSLRVNVYARVYVCVCVRESACLCVSVSVPAVFTCV